MQVGHDVPYQIKQAIETASIHIVILSPRYAQSIWCLNELEQMSKKCKSCQDIIIPVFYDVEPSVVRWTGKGKTGEYAKALSDHEEKRRANSQTIKNWRDALSDVALISGLELKKCNGGKDELLGKVVERVLHIREKRRLKYVLKEEFGTTVWDFLHPREQPQNQVAQLQSQRLTLRLGPRSMEIYNRVMAKKPAKFVGILGPGGIGKTKLAKEFLKKKESEYSGSCLISDVKENSPTSLLRKLLKDLTQSEEQIDTVEQGIHTLKRHILASKSLKYLIILDDIDNAVQMNALLPIWDVLSSNSSILVTSRYKDVLIGAGIKEELIYNLMLCSKTNLILAGNWLEELPPCLNQVNNLEKLWLRDSPNLKCLSTSSFQLPNRSGSYKLLNRLTELTIMDCGIMSLLQDLEKMKNLKVLRVCNCPLEELSFRVAVNMISQRNARLLGAASRSEASCGQCVCPNLQHLWIYSCRDLEKVGSMPKTLKTVDLSYCNTLREIEGLPDLARLEQLDISGCEEVEELPSLQALKSLKSLKASKCYKLKRINGLASLSKLRRLYVPGCHEIRELPGVEHCSSLKALDARDCPKLQWTHGVLDQLRQRLKSGLVGCFDNYH